MLAGGKAAGYHFDFQAPVCRRSSRCRSSLPHAGPDPSQSQAETPRSRPLERFWPYADLSEEPSPEELSAIDPELHTALFGRRRGRFPSPSRSRHSRAPISRARSSSPGNHATTANPAAGRTSSSRDFHPTDAAALRELFTSWTSVHVRRAGGRPPLAARARALAAARLVSPAALAAVDDDPLISIGSSKAPRRGAAQTRSRIQHVLCRTAAAPAVRDASRVTGLVRRLDREHISNYAGTVPLRDAAVAISDLHRTLGSRAARARRGTPRPL